jgi:Family of unknown function (DUF6600)
MKRILIALFAAGVLALPLAQQARSAEISIDFFYNNLPGGNWIEVDDYGYCWQPDIAVSDPSWRPYIDGYWAYTDVGWTWISYEDFGWAVYHYGRWIRLADYGWLWVPGGDLDWGPAWVSWRVGADYIGWAPLPPRRPGFVYEGGPISGHVDIEFDIGPACYNFVDVRYFGEPVLRNRIIDVHRNVTYIDKTVNVTHITYENRTVHNYGPDIHFVEQHSTRPIQRLHIERRQNANVGGAVKSGDLTRIQGQNLVVAAPLQLKKPEKQEAPPKVKAKVTQPKLDRGWAEVGNQQAQAEFKQKIKNQNLRNVPPPTAGAGTAAEATAVASASPRAPLNPAGATTQTGQEKEGKGTHRANRGEPPPVPQPTNPPGATMQTGQGREHRIERMNPPLGGTQSGRREGQKTGGRASPTPHP